jgi:hypothetical protein
MNPQNLICQHILARDDYEHLGTEIVAVLFCNDP